MKKVLAACGVCVAVILFLALLSGCKSVTGKPKLPEWKEKCDFCRSEEAYWMLEDLGVLFPDKK